MCPRQWFPLSLTVNETLEFRGRLSRAPALVPVSVAKNPFLMRQLLGCHCRSSETGPCGSGHLLASSFPRSRPCTHAVMGSDPGGVGGAWRPTQEGARGAARPKLREGSWKVSVPLDFDKCVPFAATGSGEQ